MENLANLEQSSKHVLLMERGSSSCMCTAVPQCQTAVSTSVCWLTFASLCFPSPPPLLQSLALAAQVGWATGACLTEGRFVFAAQGVQAGDGNGSFAQSEL